MLDTACDGTRQRDSVIKINYAGSGNNSQFTFDGLGRCVNIIETISGTVTSTKQFVWCDSRMSETRNSASSITSQYFQFGQTISGSNYYYSKDHLFSTHELTDSAGNCQAQYSYDPSGQSDKIQGTLAADFQYAGYYVHASSGLNLTLKRAYSAKNGRWISRDVSGEQNGVNLYNYCDNDYVDQVDPDGLHGHHGPFGPLPSPVPIPGPSTGSGGGQNHPLLCPIPHLHYGFDYNLLNQPPSKTSGPPDQPFETPDLPDGPEPLLGPIHGYL